MEIDSAPICKCSKEHQKIYEEWFNYADSDSDGRITGNDAIKFFGMSNLPRPELKQVWAIADSKRQGFLGFKEFIIAMQLVALGQGGHELTANVLNSEVELENLKPPVMDGLDELLAKKKHAPKTSEPELNGSSQSQQSPSAHWFTSTKSANKFLEWCFRALIHGILTASGNIVSYCQGFAGDGAAAAAAQGTFSLVKFTSLQNGPDERSIPGNTIAVHADMPFNGLTTFGTAFLSKFECSQMPHPLLEQITFVDTPGVLSGEKQRTQRSYDFTGVTSWFAAKCDLILLLFDPHKLDISDEFRRVISSLRGHDDKIRVVLNKADQIDTQQLMRVYGALMWSLGKVLNTPEVMRVYIGSFNDKPVNEAAMGPIGKELFEKEQDDLLSDLKDIPKKACDRRINEFVKRSRAAKIHAYIISHLRKEMPAMMGKAKAQQRLIDNLEDEFGKVQREHHLPAGDFPNVEHFREVLSGYTFDKFEKLKPKMIQSVDDMLGYDIPDLLKSFRNPYD
ncbi:EPS15 homology domain 1 [Actinidia rufa]|uniref:EPS15 homology domain 1 n=1 Tax=Actinidia rufa TaxID=165716 RepID=A0A7J0G9D7_9ERIC|nr:EPS15 homology domain 1 [Actinidia rufa]